MLNSDSTPILNPHEVRPPALNTGVLGWLRTNLFSSWFNSLLTLAALAGLVYILPPLWRWVISDALWTATAEQCRANEHGACWAFVHEKLRLILFGLYPAELQWRPSLAMGIFFSLVAASTWRKLWKPWLALVWLTSLALCFWLLIGGLGLEPVPTTRLGGLPLTLLLSVVGIGLAFPLGIVLALGRCSQLPIIKALSVGYIELIRGVPLISVLFMASVMFPLFLPVGMSIDKLLRAQIAIILFAAAYLAEVVRGGLQAIPKGQYEAAQALGLGYWQTTVFIILPQALRVAIPPIVNTFIGLFKDTSLVVIIGLFDLMLSAKTALTDPVWLGFAVEGYLFIALIYFACCFFMSRYSQYLEHLLQRGYRR